MRATLLSLQREKGITFRRKKWDRTENLRDVLCLFSMIMIKIWKHSKYVTRSYSVLKFFQELRTENDTTLDKIWDRTEIWKDVLCLVFLIIVRILKKILTRQEGAILFWSFFKSCTMKEPQLLDIKWDKGEISGNEFWLHCLIMVKIGRYSKYFKKSYDIRNFALDLYNVIFFLIFLRALKQVSV